MDDDRKKFPRKGGPRKGGKPDFSAKPRFEGGKPFVKREGAAKPPYAKRRDDATPGAERPKRDFKRDDRPREGGEAKAERSGAPFRKGPRPEGKSGFAAKPRFEGGKPFEKRDGAAKPYAKRRDDAAGGAERPKRDFKRDDRPRDGAATRPERSDKPFRAGPRPEGKPFVRRPDREGDAGGERPARRFDRPQGAREGGFEKRPRPEGFKPDGERKPFARPRVAEEVEEGERIAKRLARVGIASRRDAEELIAAGRVKVNGKILASPAFNVMPSDTIELDGETIPPIERTRMFLFHKPSGVVTTNRDPEGRKTVFDLLPAELPRLMTIGRLDINTEGLLLLTNDGGLSRVLELPATGWLRRYRVRVHGKVDEKQLAGLKDGIAVDGVFYGAIEASLDREQGTNAWLTIGLREGKNREVKNILGALGLDVTRLIRISYGPFQLGELPEGHVQEMAGRTLRDQLGERLIEESGANFDADIVKPFSNKPVRRTFDKPVPAAEPERAPRKARPVHIGEGGLIKNRKRDNERHREDVLGRLQTKPDRGFKSDRGPKSDFGDKPARGPKPDFGDRPARGPKPARGGKSERESRPIEPPGVRKANVWMAPGARPIGKGRAAAEKAEVDARKASKAQHHGKPFFDKPGGGKTGFGKPRREGDEGGKGPRGGGDRPRGPRKDRG
ncbi:pseudouridine synthase [Mesorhizobium sp. DCY119]|uniref:pseudouridine synthase n=1 Tax=Mesorhizobium sp. DCY119 TaxID=2108445 RepID=UPI000E6BEF68|nr:pseudouridine synthase [Mesorhizobium sp. DCY119]RJG45693.1 pseudouridine synthase [Mesorhizobium sp. DCY119]